MQDEWSPLSPLRFVSEKIDVEHERSPHLIKKPTAPDSILWNGQSFNVEEVISSWFDYSRKGRMALNMRPENLKKAELYFRVRTRGGRVFDIYYDRAPKDAGDHKGQWYLWRELEST